MAKLKQLNVADFQAHRNRGLCFAPGITTLVGPTDSGKSALIRALRWICLNDFSGDDFVREGAKETEVGLTLDSGEKVTRFKGKSNLYLLDEKEFKAFGSAVPEDIAKALGVSVLNFQGQHDSPFWFNETAGEVSRQLNSVVDLSVIDSTLSNLAAEVRTAQERVRLVDERLFEANAEMILLEPQRQRVTHFQTVSSASASFIIARDQAQNLERLTGEIRTKRTAIRRREEQHTDGRAVLDIAVELRKTDVQALNLRETVELLQRAQSVKAPPTFQAVEEVQLSLVEVEQKVGRLRRCLQELAEASNRIKTAISETARTEKEFAEQTRGRKCPTCQQSL